MAGTDGSLAHEENSIIYDASCLPDLWAWGY